MRSKSSKMIKQCSCRAQKSPESKIRSRTESCLRKQTPTSSFHIRTGLSSLSLTKIYFIWKREFISKASKKKKDWQMSKDWIHFLKSRLLVQTLQWVNNKKCLAIKILTSNQKFLRFLINQDMCKMQKKSKFSTKMKAKNLNFIR